MRTRLVRRYGFHMMLVATTVAGCDAAQGLDYSPSTDQPVAASDSKIDPEIVADVQAGHPRDVIVVLAEQSLPLRKVAYRTVIEGGPTDSHLVEVKAQLDEVKGRVLTAAAPLQELESFDQLPVMYVRVDSSESLAALEAHPDVVSVVEDRANQAFGTPTANLTQIGQPTVATSGYLGANTAVAVLDTGADYKRAPFNCTAVGQPASCPVVYAQDFATQDNALDTGSFHGTNVSGIVLSVAPSTKIIALDVFDGDYAYTSVILQAINWCIQNKAKYNIVAINMSLGGGAYASACSNDVFAPVIAAAKAAGILSAVASGNGASSSAISSPACAPAAVSVGAVYAANVGALYAGVCNDLTTAADKVGCFSNSASFLTLLAPGIGITAAGITMSGTSQATPHVAGAIALLASAFTTATPDALLARLTTSKAIITDTRNSVKKPRLDLVAALNNQAPALVPTGKVIINSAAAYTKTTAVTMDVSTTSGTATQVCLSATTTCSTWKTYAATQTYALAPGDGRKTVYVWWKNSDGAATATPASASITLDTTAPTNGLLAGTVAAGVATLAWSGFSDAGSGLASYKLASSTSALADCTKGTALYTGTATTFKTAKLPVGTTYFRLCATDKLGNTGPGVASSVKVTK
jgi:subtilisin family serine protease